MTRSLPFLVPLLLLLSSLAGCSPKNALPAEIIPEPKEMNTDAQGTFTLKESDKPAVSAPDEIRDRLKAFLSETPYAPSEMESEASQSRFLLSLRDTLPGIKSPEGYTLNIGKEGIEIEATGEAGLFYGIQSFLSLTNGGREVPYARITDEPRFPYRGVMIDISRHFFGQETIKKQIDAMARLKLNRLHLHLTDGAGWRLEIESYPKLTGFAAWRTEANYEKWWNGDRHYLSEGTPGAYGGYIKKDEMRELIRYARLRQITIIPEIEMPGHSEEVLAAYPELSCTHEPYKQSDFCAGNEETFRFIETVLSEVIELFPSEYIHIGGDEAAKASWADCPLCQKRMKEEGLKDLNELQSYFVRRVERFLKSKGRKIIGWDEITEGGLSPEATVMTWRGIEGAVLAVKQGNHAIMTPGAYCYLDQYQDAPLTQPQAFGGYLTLEKVYGYEPIPDELTPEEELLILGVQGNLWSEFVPTPEHLEYMLYPRLFGIAEIGWSPREKKDFLRFREKALRLLDEMFAKGYTPFDLKSEAGDRPESFTTTEHLALGKPVSYASTYAEKYAAAGDATLTDGKRGGWNFNDGKWQGFIGEGMDFIVDLGEETAIHEIGLDFLQGSTAWIYLPPEVVFYTSSDGETFTELARLPHEVDETIPVALQTFGIEAESDEPLTTARFVRCVARSHKEGAWLFTDELIIR